LPGAIGSVLYLRPLATALGSQHPIYALQTPGLQSNEVTPDSVEALAAYQLAAIRQQHPQGPYQILRQSSGGRVAFELARQFRSRQRICHPDRYTGYRCARCTAKLARSAGRRQ
ncbi:MAG: thioesterase domain-containing protein, partial [Pseudomonadota bacterium]